MNFKDEKKKMPGGPYIMQTSGRRREMRGGGKRVGGGVLPQHRTSVGLVSLSAESQVHH